MSLASGAAGASGMPDTGARRLAPDRALAVWLFLCAGCVLAVLMVGGITRLTHSGLSIVQWQPLTGVLPPLSDSDWNALFAQYQATPEFRLMNAAMTLEEFRPLFWWEYAHRLLGRAAGAVFLLPFVHFVLTGRVTRTLAWRLAGIFVLGGLQGALGWYMVASGLVDDPHVSALRLAAHLGMALMLIGLLLWTGWSVLRPQAGCRAPPPIALAALAAVFLMALSGALVAGTRAGLAYNTFPLMDGHLVPPDLLRPGAWTTDFLDNLAAVQFLHRALALGVITLVLALALRLAPMRALRSQAPGAAAGRALPRLLLVALALQVTLGIATLLSGVALPLAAAHQAGAVLLLAGVLRAVFVSGLAGPAQRPVTPESGVTGH